MHRRDLQRSMYELRGPSTGQRITLAVTAGVWVALAWWLLLGGGLLTARGRFGWIHPPGDTIRRICLGSSFSIYYVRILCTEFIFLKRGMAWSEVFSIVPWLLFTFLFLGIAGGTNPAALGIAGFAGIALFLIGSWLNTQSEYSRHVWKQMRENRGKLYTQGFFRYSRHPNYLGDLVSFSGLSLISGKWVAAAIPVLMLLGFVFVNVPVLDSHLRDRYGAAFDDYARRTSKLIPFIY